MGGFPRAEQRGDRRHFLVLRIHSRGLGLRCLGRRGRHAQFRARVDGDNLGGAAGDVFVDPRGQASSGGGRALRGAAATVPEPHVGHVPRVFRGAGGSHRAVERAVCAGLHQWGAGAGGFRVCGGGVVAAGYAGGIGGRYAAEPVPVGSGEQGENLPGRVVELFASSELLLRVAGVGRVFYLRAGLAGRVDGSLCSGPDVFVFDQSDGHQGDRGARGAVAGR